MDKEYTMDDFLQVIGRISVFFATLDFITSLVIIELIGRESTLPLPFSEKSTLTHKFYALEKMDPGKTSSPQVLNEIKLLLPHAIEVANERNRYIHDQWMFRPDLVRAGKIGRVRMNFVQKLGVPSEFSIDDLNQFLRSIGELQNQFSKFYGSIRPEFNGTSYSLK
jgi:hypothetical protein